MRRAIPNGRARWPRAPATRTPRAHRGRGIHVANRGCSLRARARAARRMNRCRCRASPSFSLRKDLGQVEGPVLGCIFEAQTDLVCAQVMYGSEVAFDLFANPLARLVQFARDGGLMLASQRADLREREILQIVIGEPQALGGR